LTSSTTIFDSLPRTLFPFDTTGDLVNFEVFIQGVPDVGDGIVGWDVTGNVVIPEPTGGLTLILLTSIFFAKKCRR
jgi:hypothetical protein